MSYISAVDHLYALGHELAPALNQATPAAPRRKFDLAHMRALMAALGDPQTTFPSVLIAGTNGKGSTAATLSSILTAAGYRTGLYTSPHLIRVNERIQIDGVQIPDEDFARLYFQVDDTANRLVAQGTLPHHPSFFEVLTALAFLYFARRTQDRIPHSSQPHRDEWGEPNTPVDIAVLEVGLGGRLDATNIVDPLISIITDIALDHQEYLGNTIAAITREKAGILRPNGILITLPQHPEANQAIGEAAAALNLTAISAAPFIPPTTPAAPQNRVSHLRDSSIVAKVGESATEPLSPNRYTLSIPALKGRDFSPAAGSPDKTAALAAEGEFATPDHGLIKVDSPLHGQHQQRNIALAIAAAIALSNYNGYNISPTSNQKSYKIQNSAIEAGIRNTRWPGRLELIPGNPPILLDVAHNPAGAWTLRAAIAQLPAAQPRTLIFSCLRDKSLKEMAQILLPLFDSTSGEPERAHDHILLAPIDNPRASTLEDLLAAARALDIPAHAAPNIAAALAEARALTPPDGLIIVTGSIYLVGEVRNLALHSAADPA